MVIRVLTPVNGDIVVAVQVDTSMNPLEASQKGTKEKTSLRRGHGDIDKGMTESETVTGTGDEN